MIPEAFGKFKNNLVLHDKVCDACNQYFANSLDEKLSRDTFEGIERFDLGVSKDRDYKHLGKRSTLTIEISEGPYKGAFAFLTYDQELHRRRLLPLEQIGIRRQDGPGFGFFLMSNLPDPANFPKDEYRIGDAESVIIFHPRRDSLVTWMEKIGIDRNDTSQFVVKGYRHEGDDIGVTVGTKVEELFLRGVAKIAFNYLSYWNASEIMLSTEFDEAREFIRFGKRPPIPLVHVVPGRILADEPVGDLVAVAHVIVTNWNTDKDALFGKVSIFNNQTYGTILARDLNALEVSTRIGHFYNIEDMTVHPLGIQKQSGTGSGS